MHRDVTWLQDTLDKITEHAAWLHAHAPDVHDLAYGPPSSKGDTPHVQTSDERDLSGRIENDPDPNKPEPRHPQPQHTWRRIRDKVRAIEIDLSALESMATKLFASGQSPEPDRPGRDTSLPPHQRKQINAAARRRQDRGEYAPTPLGKKPQR